MGIYGVAFPGGAALGGFISTYLVQAWGWRAPFWFGFTLTLLLLLGSLIWLPESIYYLVEKRPAGALQAYNKIGAKLGYLPEAELPAPHTSAATGAVMMAAVFKGVMGKRTLYLWGGYAWLAAAFYFANNWTPRLVTSYLTTKVPQGSPQASGWSDPVTVDPAVITKLAQDQPGQWDTNATYVQQMSDTAAQAIGNNAGVLVAVGGVLGALIFAYLASRFHPRLVAAWVLFFGLLTYLLYANFFKNPTLALLLCPRGGNGRQRRDSRLLRDQPARLPDHRARHRRGLDDRNRAHRLNHCPDRLRIPPRRRCHRYHPLRDFRRVHGLERSVRPAAASHLRQQFRGDDRDHPTDRT